MQKGERDLAAFFTADDVEPIARHIAEAYYLDHGEPTRWEHIEEWQRDDWRSHVRKVFADANAILKEWLGRQPKVRGRDDCCWHKDETALATHTACLVDIRPIKGAAYD